MALRIDQAEASVANAHAAMLPSLNLGFGYSEGRRKNIDFGPYSLAPWETGGNLSWEIDITGKLRAAKRASVANTEAAIWDYQSAKLLLSSRIAATRLNLYRFNAEIASLNESLEASRDTLSTLTERNKAGIIANSAVSNQRAENEKIKRLQLDLTRLRDLTVVQLRTLRGGSQTGNSSKDSFPSFDSPSSKPLNKVLALHPSLLAAEAKIRAAFRMEDAARLDLLPSFKINALASGRTNSLTNPLPNLGHHRRALARYPDLRPRPPRRIKGPQGPKFIRRFQLQGYRPQSSRGNRHSQHQPPQPPSPACHGPTRSQ